MDAHPTFTKRLIMSPKEKAEDLVNKYRYVDLATNSIEFAKRYAIIHVDEILKNFGLFSLGKKHYASNYTIEYYQDVKKEIEQL